VDQAILLQAHGAVLANRLEQIRAGPEPAGRCGPIQSQGARDGQPLSRQRIPGHEFVAAHGHGLRARSGERNPQALQQPRRQVGQSLGAVHGLHEVHHRVGPRSQQPVQLSDVRIKGVERRLKAQARQAFGRIAGLGQGVQFVRAGVAAQSVMQHNYTHGGAYRRVPVAGRAGRIEFTPPQHSSSTRLRVMAASMMDRMSWR